MSKRLNYSLRKELTEHKLVYSAFSIVLLLGTFLRTFNVSSVLGFYFDQGRDALVVADFLEKGKWFLIGPTTGIAGIFRGPFYYYLIAPFYWLGHGNPLYPALFLGITASCALILLYYLAKEGSDRGGGILAMILGGFSYFIVYASRWLSNPTPMLLLSMLLIWMMVLVRKGKSWAWIPLAFIAGSSLFHFGSSGEFFYFPALFVFALWHFGVFQKKIVLPSVRIVVVSLLAFGVTAAPLVIFDLRHDRILTNNILKFFIDDGSFKASFWEVALLRWQFLFNTFVSKIFLGLGTLEKSALVLVIAVGVLRAKHLFRRDVVKIALLMFVSPWIGLLFFQGNEGNIYDYYLTGYYLIFILIIGVLLRETARYLPGKIIVAVFLFLFLRQNIPFTWYSITSYAESPNTIVFQNQKQALNWIYEDAAGKVFNTDYYVPPVIPYAYEYLQHWYTYGLGRTGLVTEAVPLLYTVYEVDPPHPERLEAWLARQEGIGKVIDEHTFNGITVQRRQRL